MSKKQFDLHIHTYYSDGKNSPEQVLRRAKSNGLKLVSLTDHNSCSQIRQEARIAKKLRINFLPGVELSCVYQGRHLHILGYGFDPDNRELKTIIKDIQNRRKKGIFTITKKLRNLGFDIPDQELRALPTEYYGLSHIIRCLMKKSIEKRRIIKEVGSVDIFAIINFYFSHAKEAYVPEDYMPAVKMIKLIKSIGGIVSLAHPGSHLGYADDSLIGSLKACGLDAIEVFTPKHNWDQIVHYEILAKKLKMSVTAGSNYHEDFHEQDVPIVTPIGLLETPPEVFDNFVDFLTSHTTFRMKY